MRYTTEEQSQHLRGEIYASMFQRFGGNIKQVYTKMGILAAGKTAKHFGVSANSVTKDLHAFSRRCTK